MLRVVKSRIMADAVIPSLNNGLVQTDRGFAFRRLILLGLMLTLSLPAFAIRHLTVAQLEKTLASAAAKRRSDADMMREFGDFDLTERLTDATRARICQKLHLGPQTTLALQLIADESAVLDPPAGEFPPNPPPNAAVSKRILEAASTYVRSMLPHLPDFLATRTTYAFNDTAQVFKVNEWPVRAGLHLVGTSTREITFRDDKEGSIGPASQKADAPGAANSAGPGEQGLQSYGEFGTLLGIIFVDSARGSLTFHHWEETSSGLEAVYRYSVPRPESHYAVNYCCLSSGLRTNVRSSGGRRGGAVTAAIQDKPTILFHTIPGYHGSLFIDPASGVVRRLTLEAEMGDGPVSRAATVIEYGPVIIGDRKFICPVRSMNIYEGPPEFGPPASELPTLGTRALEPTATLHVNETSFTNYHRLGSEMRILTEAEAPSAVHP